VEHGCNRQRERAQRRAADEVDVPVNGAQLTGAQPVRDRATANTGGEELVTVDHPELQARQPGDFGSPPPANLFERTIGGGFRRIVRWDSFFVFERTIWIFWR
jgi:hypothetical protein